MLGINDLSHNWLIRRSIPFSKVNEIGLLEFDIAYSDIATQHFGHYATGTDLLHLTGR